MPRTDSLFQADWCRHFLAILAKYPVAQSACWGRRIRLRHFQPFLLLRIHHPALDRRQANRLLGIRSRQILLRPQFRIQVLRKALPPVLRLRPTPFLHRLRLTPLRHPSRLQLPQPPPLLQRRPRPRPPSRLRLFQPRPDRKTDCCLARRFPPQPLFVKARRLAKSRLRPMVHRHRQRRLQVRNLLNRNDLTAMDFRLHLSIATPVASDRSPLRRERSRDKWGTRHKRHQARRRTVNGWLRYSEDKTY